MASLSEHFNASFTKHEKIVLGVASTIMVIITVILVRYVAQSSANVTQPSQVTAAQKQTDAASTQATEAISEPAPTTSVTPTPPTVTPQTTTPASVSNSAKPVQSPTPTPASTPAKPTSPTVSDSVICPVDYSQAPDLSDLAAQAQQICQDNFPKIEAFLTKSRDPAPHKIIFDHNQYAAYVLSNQVHISIDFARAHPTGVPSTVAHELTHLDQGYASGGPSWATEGIADFMRHKLGFQWDYFHCNSDERWTAGYGCTASFLTYVSRTYRPNIVHDIHVAAINGNYTDAIFVQQTGKTAETLYAECRAFECQGGKQ